MSIIDDLFETVFDEQGPEYVTKMKGKIKKIARWTGLGILGLTLASGIYTVPQDSNGIIRRLGRYHSTTEPGLHYRIPLIDDVDKVNVKTVFKEEFGFRTKKAGINSEYFGADNLEQADQGELEQIIKGAGDEPKGDIREQAAEILREEYLMLTGDLNMADIEWVVQYRIKDPVAFSFNVEDPIQLIRDSSLSVMRAIVGNGSVDEAITIGRIDYEIQNRSELQKLLDHYHSGIDVVAVKLQSGNPPSAVRSAFNAVNEAMQKKEERINDAMKVYNEAVPKADGQAKSMVQGAIGYANERVNLAKGDVIAYNQRLTSYRQNQDITSLRMWYETMQEVIKKLEVTAMEQEGAEGGILQKYDIK